ncbi:MAG: hypothetical protein H6861_01040 [Rhodospirillales bacterium]|nr:hypothetical protein [Rhodospirillales bacterium]
MFSQAVRAMLRQSREQERVLRAGFSSTGRAGKTTFIKGILRTFDGMQSRESNSKSRPQNIWFCEKEDVCIRHYDASVFHPREKLNSYFKNTVHDNLNPYGFPFVDLVENPDEDMHNTRFDCLVDLKIDCFQNRMRNIAITVTTEVSKLEGFQAFAEQAMKRFSPLDHEPSPTANI